MLPERMGFRPYLFDKKAQTMGDIPRNRIGTETR